MTGSNRSRRGRRTGCGRVSASLVVGDIPPLAFAAARIADVPAIALGNFTWDWIYDGYRDWTPGGGRFVEQIRAAYSAADLALRLPMHGGFEMFRNVFDLPFIARRTARDPQDVRRSLDLPADVPLVLLSFGGYGLASIDLDRIASMRDYLVVTTADVGANRRADEPRARIWPRVPLTQWRSVNCPRTSGWLTRSGSTRTGCATKTSSQPSTS